MRKFSVIRIKNDLVNEYLIFKNLYINRIFSSRKKKIKKLDHYIWWFTKQLNRKSFLIKKNDIPIFISTTDHFKYNEYKLIYSGLLSCLPKTNLFEILSAIKIQNIYLDKQKGSYCFISIDKKNTVLLHHWKYFGYKQLKYNDKLVNILKKFIFIGKNFNIYCKKI